MLEDFSANVLKPRLHILTLMYNICWLNNVKTCSRHVKGCLTNILLEGFLIEIKTFNDPTNVSQTSSHMPATRPDIVEPTNSCS